MKKYSIYVLITSLTAMTLALTPAFGHGVDRVAIVDDGVKRIIISGNQALERDIALARSTTSKDIYTVPNGKRLIVDYVSIFLDPGITNPNSAPYVVYAKLDYTKRDGSPGGQFQLGIMEQGPTTSRGMPNFVTAKAIPIAISQERTVSIRLSTNTASVKMYFGNWNYTISARLVKMRP